MDRRKNDYEFTIFVKDGIFHPSNEEVTDFNSKLKEMVERRNRESVRPLTSTDENGTPIFPITMVDMYTALDEDVDFVDSLHPSDTGEMKMGVQWFKALTASEWWKAVAAKKA